MGRLTFGFGNCYSLFPSFMGMPWFMLWAIDWNLVTYIRQESKIQHNIGGEIAEDDGAAGEIRPHSI